MVVIHAGKSEGFDTIATDPGLPASVSAMTTPESQTPLAQGSLPVRDPVTNYEKIKRIGEGTYGVVCETFLTQVHRYHRSRPYECCGGMYQIRIRR